MLTIRYLERTDEVTRLVVAYYLRFSGEKTPEHDEFLLFKEELKRRRGSARWTKEACEGRGAWWITGTLLATYRMLFDNYEQMVAQAEEEYGELLARQKRQQAPYAIPRATVDTLAEALHVFGFTGNEAFPTWEQVRARYIGLMRVHHEDFGGTHLQATRITLSYTYLQKYFTYHGEIENSSVNKKH